MKESSIYDIGFESRISTSSSQIKELTLILLDKVWNAKIYFSLEAKNFSMITKIEHCICQLIKPKFGLRRYIWISLIESTAFDNS